MPRLPAPLLPWWQVAKTAYTRFTRAAAPASMRVARFSDHGAPHGVALTAEEAVTAAGDGARVWVARPPHDVMRPLPPGEPSGDYRFEAATLARIPRVAVAVLPGARVDGRFGGVIGPDHRLVYEFSHYFGIDGPLEHPQFLRPFRRRPTQYDGTVAVLGDRGDDNYYHFLIDVLPKLALLAECPDLPPIDAYYVPANRGFQRELLARVRVPADRVLDSRQAPYLRATRLVVTGMPDADLQAPEWAVAWLRRALLPPQLEGASRRLYLTRGRRPHTRIVRNEVEVLEALRPLGFEVFDCGAHSVEEQITAFAAAETVVAPHGASLANLVFAGRPLRLVEIFPPDYVNTCYWALAHQVPDIDYRYVLGRGPVPSGDPQAVAADIDVDVARLLRVLDL